MTPERVSYQKTFNLGSYQSERIGVDMLLNPEDDPEEALKQCKAMVESFHIETIPVIENPPVVQIQQNEPILTKEDQYIQDISTCKQVKVLETYKYIVKSNAKLQEAYDNKLKELQQ